MLISIIIPVYKSSRTLVELTHRIDKVFSSIHNSEYEIIFVNDSPFWMETSDTLKKLAAENFRVIAIELTKNFGQQPATLCGIGFAQGELVVTMDDDLQHAPEDIPRLIEKAHHDAVIAKFRSKKHSGFKRFTSKLKGYFDTIVLGKPSSLMLSAFRLFRAPIAKFMLKTNTPYPFIPALLFSITTDVVNVDVEHYERSDGASHYTFGRMFRLFSNLIVNNSSLLLRTVGYTGLVIALLSFIYAVIIAYRALMLDYAVAGWPSTFTAILFFGGMTLLTLGIIGEYLIRIIATSEQRPTYFVRNIIHSDGCLNDMVEKEPGK